MSFWGKGWTKNIQNKTYIYSGRPNGEEEVMQTLKNLFPEAQFSLEEPSEDDKNSNKKFLQQTKVEPLPVGAEKFKNRKVRIKTF